MSYTGDKVASLSASMLAYTGSVAGTAIKNGGRQGSNNLFFFNDTNQSVYICFGTSGSRDSGFTNKVASQASWGPTPPFYTGPIVAYWQTAPSTGSLLVTESS